ncbi:hypothetical protein PFISCL1PPCAC_14286, partial [Pristionchus fissidentatus]
TPPPYTESSQHVTITSPPVNIYLRNSETHQSSESRNRRFKRLFLVSCAFVIVVIASATLLGVFMGWNP